MLVELGSHVHVGSLNSVEHELGDSEAFAVGQVGLEEDLGRFKTLATELDDPPIRKLGEEKIEMGHNSRFQLIVYTLTLGAYLVRLDEHGGLEGQTLLFLDIVSNVAQTLFHNTNGLKVGRMIEGVASQEQQLKCPPNANGTISVT